MSTTFAIKSTESDLKLVLSELNGEFFTSRLVSEHLSALRVVCTYTDSHGLANLLERVSKREKPWDGEEYWEGIEGDFRLSVSCSSLGVITFMIRLTHYGIGENWKVETELKSEMGQLPEIARSARVFFGPSPY